ncbi:MAG: hypothetical protein J6A26_04875 [Oscillospiraceae bacterium]|nr:hypothetical protein [Oscillospiraceae bacterium]
MKETIQQTMRKLLIFLAIPVALVLISVILLSMIGYSFHTGTYLEGRNDSHLVLLAGVPTQMSNPNPNAFDSLESGDRVLFLLHGGVAESYPQQASIPFCIRLNEGDLSTVDPDTLKELRDMGWIS